MDILVLDETRYELWQKARHLLVNRQLDEALALLEELARCWHEPELWLDYAEALFSARNYAKAQGIVSTIINEYPTHWRAHHLQADLKYKQKFFKEALQGYQYVLTQNPEHLTSLISSAYCYCQLQLFEQALPFFEQSEKTISSKSGAWLLNYGMALLFSKKPQSALSYLIKALEHFPHDPQIYYHCGLCHGLIGNENETIEFYVKALCYDNQLLAAHHNLAIIYYSKEYYDDALKHLRFLTVHDPLNIIAKTLLAAYEGEHLERLSSTFIQTLFDQYAFNYDNHLKETLKYDVPTTARNLLATIATTQLLPGTIIDMGCGTGLAGPVFRDLATQLIGIDLSQGMLAQARQLEIYDLLIEDDILSFLKQSSLQPRLMLAFELSNYLGHEFKNLILQCDRLLQKGGWLIATCEISSVQDVELTRHARYAFSENYIKSIFADTSLSIKACHRGKLRLHHHSIINGFFIFAQKI